MAELRRAEQQYLGKKTMERIREYEKTITLQEACYYGFFVLLSLAKGLGFYEGQKLFYLLVVPALALGFLRILVTP